MEMNIKVTKTSDNKIDVRDGVDIRLMLLTENENKGLYTYFEIRMAQAKEAKTRAEQALNLACVTPAFKKGDKITLNTGHRCDTGEVIRCDEFNIVWKSAVGGEYDTPLSMYNVTLLNEG